MLLRMADNSHRTGVTTVQRIGPWQVTTFRPPGFAAGGPHEIRIEPAPDGDPQEIARGISSTVLRQITTTTPGQDLAQQRAESAQGTALEGLSEALTQAKGVTDEYLAVLSAFYVRVVEIGQRAPIQALEAVTGTKQATLKGHLRAARQRGFLTKVEGKAGGQLTDKAVEMLRGINVEQVRQP